MDFTVNIYRKLLETLIKADYSFQTFTEFLEKPEGQTILLRHDVDDKKLNSLEFAKIQQKLGVKGSYYFRMVPQSFDEKVISEIADLGHEIGYHYEDMDFAAQKLIAKGQKPKAIKEEDLYDQAITIFEKNLTRLKEIYPVKTICMHGSPRSPFDNKALWKKYNYRDYGVIGEPYFDIDFNDVFYLTDTGRMWDGHKVSIRDKVGGKKHSPTAPSSHTLRQAQGDPQPATPEPFPKFHSTSEIINAALSNQLPNKIMFTFHPQRWNDAMIPWAKEFVMQNIKNQVKKYIIKRS